MPPKPAPPFGAHLGRRLREIREGRGWRQDDVAAAAQDVGLDWSRATVAAIESGRRQLGAEELLLLPLALSTSDAGQGDDYRDVTLADLVPSDEWVEMTHETRLKRAVLERIARSETLGDVTEREQDTPRSRGTAAAVDHLIEAVRSGALTAALKEQQSILKKVWPEGANQTEALYNGDFRRDWQSELVEKASRRLDVPAYAITAAAFRLWGRGLGAERDARLAQAIEPGASARTAQAMRGHITRALLAEVEKVVAVLRPRREREG